MNTINFRELRKDEYELFDEFLYQAIFIPEGIKAPDRTIIKAPELDLYIRDFGDYPDDLQLAVEVNEKIIGLIWSRIMDDYGHIDDETPSLALSLLPEYRSRGIGKKLLTKFINVLKDKGYKSVSLSVQKENYAAEMYKKVGFEVLYETGEEYIMILELN